MVQVTQKQVLDAQVKEGKATPQQVTLLQKMGLANPSRSAEIDADVAAIARGDLVKTAQAGVATADTLGMGKETAANALASAKKSQSTAELQVVTALGLKPAIDMAAKLNAPQNAAVKTIIDKHTGEFAKDGKFDPFLKAMGGRIQQDPSIIDALGKQLADPKLAARFERDMVQQPAKMAELIQKYDPKTFGKDLATIDGEPEIMAAAVTTPSAITAPKPGKKMATPAATTAPAPAQAANAPAASEPPIVGSPGVVMIATNIADAVKENFKELEGQSDDFLQAIKQDPALQVRIKAQLDKNPEFVKQLQSMKSGEKLSDGVKKTMLPFMQDFLHNPQRLGTDEGMKETIQKFGQTKSEATMSGITDWVKNTLGFDMSGMMSGLKGFFQQIGDWFKGIMGQFSGGNFQSMRNSGMGLFGAFQQSMAVGSAYNRYSPSDMTAYPIKGADGKIFHQESYQATDENGNKVTKTREVPNTLTVKSINGTEHKYIPAAGLLTKQDTQGNWHVALITDIERNGQSKAIQPDVVLSPAEYKKFVAESEAHMGGRKIEGVPMPEPTVITSINAQNAQQSAPVVLQPAGVQSSGVETRPVRPNGPDASNDPKMELIANG